MIRTYRKNGNMKKDDIPIKIGEALTLVKREWPNCPDSVIAQATKLYEKTKGTKGLPFTRSGEGSRAHKYVRMTEVREYLQSLAA